MINIGIRVEAPQDLEAIRRVETQAFGQSGEADLVDALRSNGALTLSLIAEVDGHIVGHIAFSPGTIVGDNGSVDALALGPVAVNPTHQNQGIGSKLIRESLRKCKANGHRIVFLLGHTGYYPRFGFSPAKEVGIHCDFADPSSEAFMVMELMDEALEGCKGLAKYRPEFDGV